MWYIRGSSYNECAVKIFTEKTQFLKAGSYTGEFLMDGKRIVGKKNAWYIPRLTNGALHPAELAEFFAGC